MDFRDNWLRHFQAIVDALADELGSKPAAYRELARKVDFNEATIYQHYARKSGKEYPSAELMARIERHFGDGRPAGWSAAPYGEGEARDLTARRQSEWPLPLVPRERLEALSLGEFVEVQGMILRKIEEYERSRADGGKQQAA